MNDTELYKMLGEALDDLAIDNSEKKSYQEIKKFMDGVRSREREKQFKKENKLKNSYNGYNPSSNLMTVVSGMLNTTSMCADIDYDIGVLDKAYGDIIHEIELIDLEENEKLKLYEELRENRKLRRKYKNVLMVSKPIYDYVNNNPTVVKSLRKLLGEVAKAENFMKDQKYTPRVRDYNEERLSVFKKGAE